MWRRLLARVHPDAGGSHELYVWTGALRDLVFDGLSTGQHAPRRDGPGREDPARVPYEAAFGDAGSFAELTRQAVDLAGEVPEVCARLLRLLVDCREALDGPLARQQHLGASYRQLAYVAHLAGMTPGERRAWYRVAERVPLSQRHAGHLVERLLAGTGEASGAA
jgi:hypothetical protein